MLKRKFFNLDFAMESLEKLKNLRYLDSKTRNNDLIGLRHVRVLWIFKTFQIILI
jgi:hypothetical protein